MVVAVVFSLAVYLSKDSSIVAIERGVTKVDVGVDM